MAASNEQDRRQMSTQTKTWPYGTTRKATVAEIIHERSRIIQIVTDDHGEAHILTNGAEDQLAAINDFGTLTFCAGGPTGGYWKFTKDKA
jgi:hypothetical protein